VGDHVILRWDGHSWRRTNAPQAVYYFAVGASSPRDVWAAGFTLNGFVVTHWNGSIWRRVSVPRVPSGAAVSVYLDAILALGPRNVWLTGGPPPFAAHWDGRKWTSYKLPTTDPLEDPSQSFMDSVAERTPHDILVAGNADTFEWRNGAWSVTGYSDFHDSWTEAIASRGGTLWGLSGGQDAYSGQLLQLAGSAWVPIGKPVLETTLGWLTTDSRGGVWAVGWTFQQGPAIVHYQC
jgi:hypothetical protein